MVFITVHFNILCLTCCYKECQNLEILSSIIFLPSFGLKVLFTLHPQCLVFWKNPKDGPGTRHWHPSAHQCLHWKQSAAAIWEWSCRSPKQPCCFVYGLFLPFNVLLMCLFIVVYGVLILSDKYCLSLIVLMQLAQPTVHMPGWLVAGSDKQYLSNKVRTLYAFVYFERWSHVRQ